MKRRQFIQAAGIGLAASAIAKPVIAQSMTVKRVRNEDLGFASDDVRKVLQAPNGPLRYMGSASSHFQAEPLVKDTMGDRVVASDWEMEVMKNIEGKPSKIHGSQHPEEFPQFLAKKNNYVGRSAEMGETMFRFSLDFARLCPRVDSFDLTLMSEYVRVLARIRARGLEPMLTLYHWPMPKHLLKLDSNANIVNRGWEHPEAPRQFRFYLDSVLSFLENTDLVRHALETEGLQKEVQDRLLSEGLVNYFLTINEPSSVLMNGYMFGSFPPYKKGNIAGIKLVLGALADAHDAAFSKIKNSSLGSRGASKVGAGYNWTYLDGMLSGATHKVLDERIVKRFEKNGDNSDFLGLQYYCRLTVPSLYPPMGPVRPKGRWYGDHPDFGDVYPPGISAVLAQMHELYPQKDIFITEFGFSDRADKRRPYWILETFRYVVHALKSGIPVKGMLLWSLVNNFEWRFGMDQKFGLFDEHDLNKSLQLSEGNEIRGWEAWRVATNTIKNPSAEAIDTLQTCYERAKQQFEQATTQRL